MARRSEKSRAFKAYVRRLRESADIYAPKPDRIFNCLSQAHSNERSATSGQLARGEMRRHDPEAELPGELSDQAIRQYYVNAADCYSGAAIHYIMGSDLRRAFKYFRKAASLCSLAASCHADGDPKAADHAKQYRETAAIVRYELARRSMLRKKLSLGLLGRLT